MRPAAATPDSSKLPSPEQTGSTTRKNSSSRNFLQRIRSQRQAQTPAAPVQQPFADETLAKRQETEGVQTATEKAGFLNSTLEPPLDGIENPLKWWAKNAHKYPLIAHVARNALAVPASSAPFERLFSQSGLVMNQRRNKLKSKRLETLLFLKGSWLAAEAYAGSPIK